MPFSRGLSTKGMQRKTEIVEFMYTELFIVFPYHLSMFVVSVVITLFLLLYFVPCLFLSLSLSLFFFFFGWSLAIIILPSLKIAPQISIS